MEDLDILKAFAMTEKTQEDIEAIMGMTQELKFVISYNDSDIHKLICQNMRLASYDKDAIIFDSSKMNNIDFLIYSGTVNLYLKESPGVRIHFSDDEENEDSSTTKEKNKKKKNKKKTGEEKKEEEDEKEDVSKLFLMRELKTEDCFGSFEVNIIIQNNSRFEKLVAKANEETKVLVFENKRKLDKNNKAPVYKTLRDIRQTQRELAQQDKNNPKYYDPDIFLFEDPQKIIKIIDNVKEQVNETFNGDQSIKYFESIISEMKCEKEFMDVCSHLTMNNDLRDTLNYIDNKYEGYYIPQTILELKLGAIIKKCLLSVDKAQNNLLNDLDDLRHKYYDKNNNKNRNLVQLNIDNELSTEQFENFIYDKMNLKNNLDILFKQKKKNDKKIEENKKIIKKDENKLLTTYYCIYCHIKPRNAMSDNCNHLLICDECIQKTKVCPKCGKNITGFHKIYRD